MAIYYQRIYMESVAEYCTILLELKNFNKTEEICRRAIELDPFVETNHAILIKALIGQKNYDKAIHHYNYVNKLFYDELGVRPSDLITKLYHEITNKNSELDIDITHIKANLKEETAIMGAVYCNYEEFKMIYQFEARAALRSGKTVFIALITVTGKQGRALTKNHFEDTFEMIRDNIVRSLRKDDIVTRYGRTQFLLMLANLTLEDSNMVLSRLMKKMNESGIVDGIEVIGQLQSLDPVELEASHV
jgi:tetratricopeptide (TPR) repeat protein